MTRRQCFAELPFSDFTFPKPKGEGLCGPPAPCSPSVTVVGEASGAPSLKWDYPAQGKQSITVRAIDRKPGGLDLSPLDY